MIISNFSTEIFGVVFCPNLAARKLTGMPRKNIRIKFGSNKLFAINNGSFTNTVANVIIEKFEYHRTTDTLRDVQISIFPKIFQVSNGYMKFIGFWWTMSNSRPEKCGFEKIKRANP